jgi:hypothetical protein
MNMTYLKMLKYCTLAVVLGLFIAQIYAQVPDGSHVPNEKTTPDETPAWMVAIGLRHQELVERNGPGTDTAMRDRLLEMLTIDQQARADVLKKSQVAGVQPDLTGLQPVDEKLTAELREIVSKNGWPTIHLVGFDASNAAMTILIHTQDQAWQRGLLPMLEHLSEEEKIDSSQLATLIDKELIAAGKRQRYGTQFKTESGHLAMFAVEEPDTVDVRRAAAMLPPLKAYKQILASAYGMPMSDDVVSPSSVNLQSGKL